MAARRKPAPPEAFAAQGTALWQRVAAEFEPSAFEAAILTEACRTVDELQSIRDELRAAETIVVVGSTGQPRAHPLLDEVRRHRETLARLLTVLGVDEQAQTSRRKRLVK
jgi:hypothetical protein